MANQIGELNDNLTTNIYVVALNFGLKSLIIELMDFFELYVV